MEKKLQYITQISRQDMSDIDDAVQMYGGDGIIVDKTSTGLEISIDDRYLRDVILDEIDKFMRQVGQPSQSEQSQI